MYALFEDLALFLRTTGAVVEFPGIPFRPSGPAKIAGVGAMLSDLDGGGLEGLGPPVLGPKSKLRDRLSPGDPNRPDKLARCPRSILEDALLALLRPPLEAFFFLLA
jgi:hypothetical protein